MVEENPAARKQTMGITIVDCHPVGIELCDCIRTPWAKRGRLTLRRSRHAKHF